MSDGNHKRDALESELAFQRVCADWQDLTQKPSPVPDWELQFTEMAKEMATLRSSGQWRSGGRTLLYALGLHRDEVRLCRALAWLMTPDGWHGLGDLLLAGLLNHLELEVADTTNATIVTEEVRGQTRADIVARLGSRTLIIEAKVTAGEQPQQADRLAKGWADESPSLVFLTPEGGTPRTAVESAGQWRGVAWSDVAEALAWAVEQRPDCAPGARDMLETIQRYGR